MMKRLFSVAMIAALVSSGTMAEAQRTKAAEVTALPGYRIGPEDVLQISVSSNEALSRTVPVRPDGMNSLPLLNDVKAAGLTPMAPVAVPSEMNGVDPLGLIFGPVSRYPMRLDCGETV